MTLPLGPTLVGLRVNIRKGDRSPHRVDGQPMTDVEVVALSGDFLIVQLPGTERDQLRNVVTAHRCVKMFDGMRIEFNT